MIREPFILLFAFLFPCLVSAQNITLTKTTSSTKKGILKPCLFTMEVPVFSHKTNSIIQDKLNNKIKDIVKAMKAQPKSNLCNIDIIYSSEYISDTLISIPFFISYRGDDNASAIENGPAISNTVTLNLIVSEDSSEVISAPSIPKKNLPSIESLCRKYIKSAIESSGIKDSLPDPPTSCDLVESSNYAFSKKGTKFFVSIETYTGMTIESMTVFDLEIVIPYKDLSPSKLLFGIN
jgi:hypothetical protein